jgi:hypothetical protein
MLTPLTAGADPGTVPQGSELCTPPLPQQQDPTDDIRNGSHGRPVARLAIHLSAVSHFTTTLSDIDIHSLVASYEHEARKKFRVAMEALDPSKSDEEETRCLLP